MRRVGRSIGNGSRSRVAGRACGRSMRWSGAGFAGVMGSKVRRDDPGDFYSILKFYFYFDGVFGNNPIFLSWWCSGLPDVYWILYISDLMQLMYDIFMYTWIFVRAYNS